MEEIYLLTPYSTLSLGKDSSLNELFLFTDSGDSVALLLLDLTAAFDTVDHDTLISVGNVLSTVL